MSSTHQQLAGRHARAWWTALMVAALGAVTIGSGGRAADPVPGDVLLVGPTGSRGGSAVEDPGFPPDPASIAPFDTYGRDPRLRIASPDPDDGWVSWRVEASAVSDPAPDPTSLASGAAEVPVETVELTPPGPGDWLVTATLDGGEGTPSGTWAWRLVIPDRILPETIPAPDLVLFGGGVTAIAERGSFCYLGTCGDIGRLPPDGTLPLVRLDRPDEPIALTLSDGGGIASVWAAVTPIGAGASDGTGPTVLFAGDLETATNVVLLPSPPGPGRWRLELQIGFTDGRGDSAAYARVLAP